MVYICENTLYASREALGFISLVTLLSHVCTAQTHTLSSVLTSPVLTECSVSLSPWGLSPSYTLTHTQPCTYLSHPISLPADQKQRPVNHMPAPPIWTLSLVTEDSHPLSSCLSIAFRFIPPFSLASFSATPAALFYQSQWGQLSGCGSKQRAAVIVGGELICPGILNLRALPKHYMFVAPCIFTG